MDRQAFKQRMQNLKSYRENNPGKGYWDWKVEAFQGGGEIGNEERQYLHGWYTNRREYAKRHMPAMLKQLDDADIYIDPNSRIRNIYSTPITISNDKIKQASKDSGIGEYGGYYHPNEGVVLPSDYKQWKDREPLLHELNHVVNTFNSSIFDQVNKVLEGKQIIDRGQEVNNYLTTPSEVQSRLIEFRKLNNLDPTKVYGIPDVREWRRTGKDADLLNTFDDDTVLELINTVAHTPNKKVQRAAEGGQTGDPERGVPYGSTTHEINHFSDFLKNQSPDAVGSSNMYKWMRSAIKPYSDSVSKYFSSPTEQKAYMNQLREFMYTNKMIDTRDQVVTPSLIKTALDKLPKGMDSIKKASDQFKSLKSYTKWFNTVPLLGVGAIGANKYFTNNESRN